MKIISYLCRLLVCVLLLLTTNALKATESLVLPVSATASAHTVWGGTWYTGPANLAIDQNNITKWTLEGMGWIDFDLGSTKNIHEVRAYWGGSVSNGNCVNIYIDGTKVISNHKCGAYENVIPLDAPRSGRMIRYETIALPHNEYNQIATWSELAEFTVLVGTVDTDSDSDGLVDSVETNTGVFVSASDTGSNPNNPDSDGDFLGDGFEVNISADPNVKTESQAYGLKIKSVTKPSSFGKISNAKEIQMEGNTLAAWESSGNGNIHLFNFSEGQLTYQSSIASPDASHDWPAFGAQMSLLGDRLVTGNPITWISGIHDGRGYQYNIQDLQNPQFEHCLDRDAQTATYIGGYVLAVNGFSILSSSGWSDFETQNKVHIFRENGEFYQTWTDGYNKLIEFARSPSGDAFIVSRTESSSAPAAQATKIDIYYVTDGNIQHRGGPQLTFQFSYNDFSSINESANQHSFHRFAFDGNKIYAIDDDYLRIFSLDDGAWNETSIDLRKYSGGSKFSSSNLLLGADFLIVSSPNADCRDASKGCVVIFDIDSANQTLRYRETITNGSAISGEFGSYVALDEKTGHLLVSTEFGSSHAWGVVNSNNGNWITYEGLKDKESSFQIIDGSFTWHEAKADAEARGGRLAVLDTQEKMDAVRDLFQATEQSNHLHLGMTDEQQEGEWQWIDGSPVALTNWEIGEPNNQGDEDYGMIYFPSAKWNDGHASSYWGYLLEMPSDNLNVDTDGDGLVDSVETNTGVWVSLNNTGTDPNKADSDADGLTDGDEVNQHATNPLIADTDGDGYSDGNEVQSGSNPSDSGSVPNAYSGPLFTDITTEVPSLAKHSIVAVMDYNRDGKEDLLVGTDSGTRLLKQTGSFQFDDITAAAGLDGLQNVLVADFTNDGLEDILDIASDKTYASIRANNGEGYYVKTDLNQVIEGDLSSYRDLMTGDIDNDGDIDLIYAVNPPFGGGAVAYLPNITKRGAQNVQFGQKSYLVRTSWQFAKFDLTDANNDGLTDLVILQTNGSWPYDTHPDHPAVLYLGAGRDQNDYLNPEGSNAYVGFVEKADCGINAANEMSRFTSWDIDNDGDLDLINGSSDWRWVSNPHIYINDGAGNYAQQGSPVYHSGDYYHHGITIFDADADNDLDAVWTGLHNFSNIYPRMWKNKGGLSFNDVTVEWGIITSQIAGSGNLGSNGYAADLDDDGDQDFVVQGGNGWGSETYYSVYRNNADQKGSKCLKIELEGTSSHAKGFGARVEVRANGKTLSQWVSNHVGSVPTSRLHFGLGESHDVEFINVYWPSGLKSSLSNPNIVGNTLKITEPASEPAPRFQIIEGPFTWYEAKADAEARGGRLTVLDTQEKIDEVNTFLHSQGTWPVMWTGMDGVINYEEYIDYNEPVFSDEYERYEWFVMLAMQEMQLNDASLCKKVIWEGRYPDSISFGQIDMDFQGHPLRRPGEIWIMIAESPIVYSYLLEFPKKVLSLASSTRGVITGSGEYNTGTTATLTATPDAGYIFAGWTGDATGTTNPLSLTMDADKVVGANFEPDQSDSDGDGLTNYEELAIYYTNPSLPDTDGDGHSDAGEVQRGSDPCNPASIPAKSNNWIESFTLIPNNIYSDAPFLINFPTASSGLPVVVSIKSGPATISGTTVTLTGVGTVVLAANQAGNANYLAAAEVTTSFTVSKATQTISAFATISPKAFGSAPFAVTAPASTSGLPVTLSVKSGPATISGNTVTMTGVGTVVLAANQAGNANYTAATEVTKSFTVTKAAQTIAAFAIIGNKAYADLPFTVTAPVASSGLPVNLKVKSGPATISGNTVALTGVGTVILAANQAGNANYLSAQEVTTSFAVSKATQTISAFVNITPKTFGVSPFTVTAPTSNRSLPVTLSVKSGPATISGNTVTLTGAGTVILAANQAGNANYLSAPEVTTSFTVSKATQTIGAFATITSKTFGTSPFTVTVPTSNRSLPVTLSVKSGPATISGNTVTLTGAGTVILAANQAGNANYLSAPEVTTSFTVSKATQTIGAFATITSKTFGASPFTVTVPTSNRGLPVTLSVKSGPATISGNTATITGVGTVILAANQSGDANYLSAAEVTTSFTVSKATQTIGAFTAISPKKLGSAPFAVTWPLASSKLPVVLKVKSGPANISGNTVTVTGVGTVVLAANQAGNDNYMSAREVTTSFKVTK